MIRLDTNTDIQRVIMTPIVPFRLVYISSLRTAATLVPYALKNLVMNTPPTISIMLSTISVIKSMPSYPQAFV